MTEDKPCGIYQADDESTGLGESCDSNETHPICELGHTDLMDVVVTGSVQLAACRPLLHMSGDAVRPLPFASATPRDLRA